MRRYLKYTVFSLMLIMTASCGKLVSDCIQRDDEMTFAPYSIGNVAPSASTRGIPASPDNLKDVVGDKGILVKAFARTSDGALSEYFSDVLLNWESFVYVEGDAESVMNQWASGSSTHYFWQDNTSYDFWAMAPNNAPGVSLQTLAPGAISLKFDYATPKAIGIDAGKKDAEAQNDILVAYQGNQQKDTHGGVVGLTFIHTLASVRFEMGETIAGLVESVSIQNVYGEGLCQYNLMAENALGWNLAGKTATAHFSQEFNVTVYKSTGDVTQQITDAEGYEDGRRTYMMIPQKFGDDAKLVVVFNGKEYSTPLKIEDTEVPENSRYGWEAGTRYTYVFSLANGTMTVDVNEWKDGGNKKIKF